MLCHVCMFVGTGHGTFLSCVLIYLSTLCASYFLELCSVFFTPSLPSLFFIAVVGVGGDCIVWRPRMVCVRVHVFFLL